MGEHPYRTPAPRPPSEETRIENCVASNCALNGLVIVDTFKSTIEDVSVISCGCDVTRPLRKTTITGCKPNDETP